MAPASPEIPEKTLTFRNQQPYTTAVHLITTHTQADFDALAAMLAVKKLHPDATLAFPGELRANVREYLKSAALADYTFLAPPDIEPEKVSTLTIVDTRSSRSIGPFAACLERRELQLNLYDHHPRAGGDLQSPTALLKDYGATTTLLVELLQQQKIPLSTEEATTLALGIYEDTGAMTHLTTTAADLQAAAWLLEQGARLEVINRYLQRELTRTQLEILYEMLDSAQSYTIQETTVVILTWAGDEYIDDFGLIVSRFMSMEQLSCVFALVSMAGRLSLIARSEAEEINAGEIARDFGGGGHRSAGAAIISDITLIQAQEKLVHVLHRHIRPAPMAAEMMSSPAITIPLQSSIARAQTILSRYNITAAPVVSDGQVIGLISSQTIKRAHHHHLEYRPVGDYMSSDFASLGPTATLTDVQEIIINNRQRIIPIIHPETKELAGIITRTDLLNRLISDPAHLPQRLRQNDGEIFAHRRNLSGIIVETLDKEMILLLRTIGELAEQERWPAYAVGGFVRDLLLKKPNLDLDIVIEGDGIAFAKRLAAHTGGRYRPHERFKTAVVLLPKQLSKSLHAGSGDGTFKIDVATARMEHYESPAAMPTVELSSIKLDLYRRDFTINAMAIQLNPSRFGQLIDYFHSQRDLKRRTIKTLHNLSFVEDPSRIFRAIRFEKRMEFQLSPHTRHLIKNAVDMNLFDKGDDIRFCTELKSILSEKNPLPALERLGQFQLYQFLWPDLEPHYRIDRRYRHILIQAQQTLVWHKLLFPEEPCCSWMVYLLTIMSRSRGEVLENFCDRFKESPKNRAFLVEQKQLTEKSLVALRRNTNITDSAIVEMLRPIELEGLIYMMAIARKKHVVGSISRYIRILRQVTPLLGGKDLIGMGYRPGPDFKKMLDFLLAEKLDNKVESAAEEQAAIRRMFPLPTA